MSKNLKIIAIVVTYNGKAWIKKCLDSLRNSSKQVEIIVIDNGSEDGTQEIIKKYEKIKFIQSETNLGFGKANNKGIKIALANKAEYVFLLNQDAWVEKHTIDILLKVANSNLSYGVISPIHLNGNYSGLDLNFSIQLSPQHCPGFYSDLYVNKNLPLYEIEFVNAAAWLLSIDCIRKVGFFEPLFFLYGEDNNYLQRVTFHKFKIGITPLCTICHDRDIRQGKFNERGLKIKERTYSLIILLNILYSYRKSCMIFLKEKILSIIKNILIGKFKLIKYPIAELFFFIRNIRKNYRIRNCHKQRFS